jgi:hypothetical protein
VDDRLSKRHLFKDWDPNYKANKARRDEGMVFFYQQEANAIVVL